jgi:hypothetical protein
VRDLALDKVQPVRLANAVVRFPAACRLAGFDVPEAKHNGSRAYCPFGEWAHPDGGRERALRVYSDHGFCFAEWKYFTPVSIFAEVNGLLHEDAAVQILALSGFTPASWKEHWHQLTTAKPVPDVEALEQALRIWLDGVYAGWKQYQYDGPAATAFSRCLGLLSQVRTEADCSYWLESAKQVMARVLGGIPNAQGVESSPYPG